MSEPVRPEALSPFVGTWKTTGATRATADAPSQRVEAMDRYEWMAGGFFLLHQVESRLPEAFEGLEVIGHDPASGGYLMTWYDSQGRTFTSIGRLNGRDWRIDSGTERFIGTIADDGQTVIGSWERSEDGRSWAAWMDVTLTKVRE